MVTEATCLAEAVAERLRVEWDSTLVDHHTRPAVALYRATHLSIGKDTTPDWVQSGYSATRIIDAEQTGDK